METFKNLVLCLALLGSAHANAGSFEHHYTPVSTDGCLPDSSDETGERYICRGRADIMLNMTFGDWTNMDIAYNGFIFQTWKRLVDVGSFTRVGGDNHVVEWVYEKLPTQAYKPVAIIARVQGTNPQTLNQNSKLMILGFRDKDICFLGYRVTNAEASRLAESFPQLPCLEPLPKERDPAYSSSESLPDKGPLEARTIPTSIQKISIASFKTVPTGNTVTGYFDLDADYCGSSKEFDLQFQVSGPASMQHDVYLGGSLSTIRTVPVTYSFQLLVPKNVGLASACFVKKTTLKLKCEIQPGYDGARCDFKINKRQTISLEVLGSAYHHALLD